MRPRFLSRPFEPTGMTTEQWLHVPVETVSTEALIFTQDLVSIEALLTGGREDLPHVVRYRGELYVSDGHHRIVRQVILGARAVTAQRARPRRAGGRFAVAFLR